ncbi:hypothetical protein PINS_up013438 [Pythium insidiosum]|nr:hypothetical protein PINS_up013438 [Pythium insidiosum]
MTAHDGAELVTGKKKRRRMKQMEGLLLVTRLPSDDSGKSRAAPKPRKAHVVLQPQQLQLLYSAPEDQEMQEVLGRVGLDGAQLEQVPDGFVIHGADRSKKFKLHDKEKATIDAWFLAVYTAATEFARTPVDVQFGDTMRFSAAVTGSVRDELTEALEFELSCQAVISSRHPDEPSIRWKVWRSAAEFQAFDE